MARRQLDAGQPDLLLLGADLLDTKTGDRRPADLAYRRGSMVALGEGLSRSDASAVVRVDGSIAVPGFIDLHAHVFDGYGESVSADHVCLTRGSTTVVDAGSAGAASIRAFHRSVARARTRVLAWLNLSTVGLIDPRVGELVPGAFMDEAAARQGALEFPGWIVGFKARLSSYAAGDGALRVLGPLRRIAEEAGLPIMVHVGDTAETLDVILEQLRPGDVVTHALTGRKHGIVDSNWRVLPAVLDARTRGIKFDAARGRNHLSFAVLKAALEQGFLPDTLSTDMTTAMAADPTYGQATLANYFLTFGVPLHELVRRMSELPAHVIRDDQAELKAGQRGDVTLLRIESGRFTLSDVDGRSMTTNQRLQPVGVVRAGRYQSIPTA
jgi:dihydroorotase